MLILLPFAWLWYRLIDELRLEWASNPQYGYGWVVPFLCVGLIWKRWDSLRSAFTWGAGSESTLSRKGGKAVLGGFLLLAFLYLPTRLIEEATPEWRAIQWSLGLETVGLTLCVVYLACGQLCLRRCLFAICFILIAIPWPTLIEAPVIQTLTRLNSGVVVEMLNWLRIPAIQHGNLIELNTGTIGVNEACSGIRSFQTSLMVSLFFGELYGMGRLRRLLLIPAGFMLAMGFNVCRVLFLAVVAAKKGMAAIAQYHDPAGLMITLVCTAGLWGLAALFSRGAILVPDDPAPSQSRKQEIGDTKPRLSMLRRLGFVLLLWLVTVDAGADIWYRTIESHLPPSTNWSVMFPTDNPTYQAVPFSADTEYLLRFDEGKQATWIDPDGSQWQAFYYSWRPGRVAGYLAKRHTPEICLPAAGTQLLSGPKLTVMTVNGVELPMRSYVFGTESGPLYVFQCRWEAGVGRNAYVERESSRFNLIRGIWAGRGNKGQKVLEIVIASVNGPDRAAAALGRQLEKLVVTSDQ
jgi:exosortase